MNKRFLLSVLILSFLVFSLFSTIFAASYSNEERIAIIVVYDTINSTSAIQNWVNQIKDLNYNAIAVHSRFRGDATYFPNKTNSSYPNNEPRSGAAGSIDVLQEFITRGNAKGLKVYAYVNCYLVTDGKNTDSRANHILNAHPSWVTYYYNGGSPIVQTTSHDSEGKWIDPGIPAAQDYIANICGDIMKNYSGIAGIILDRIRYPQTSWTRTNKDFGYHPTAISRFRSQYGGSGVPDPYDSNWIKFRQEQITATVQKIKNVMKSINSSKKLYAYPIGRYSDALNYNYQNWPVWLDKVYCDGVFPQIYTSDNSLFSTRCDENKNKYPGKGLLGVATMAYTSGIDVKGQIRIARSKGFVGISPYRHGVMSSLGYFNHLREVFGIVVDNAYAGFSASSNWATATSATDKYGTNYRYRSNASVSDAANWNVSLPVSGDWEVYAWWSQGSNRTASAPYIVYYSGGSSTINVNQRVNGGKWNYLTKRSMNSGSNNVKLSCWTSSGSVLIADAVMWIKP